MKTVELKLVSELMKDSRRSDRELAKAIGRSQPTVSRMIKKLEKEGIIKEYTIISDFRKLGFEILAITFFNVEKEPKQKTIDALENVLMFERGLGLKSSHVVVSLHKDYSSFAEFQRRLKQNDSWTATDSASFLVNLHDNSDFLSLSALARDVSKTTL